jgi:hypothetical protein
MWCDSQPARGRGRGGGVDALVLLFLTPHHSTKEGMCRFIVRVSLLESSNEMQTMSWQCGVFCVREGVALTQSTVQCGGVVYMHDLHM